MPLTHGAQCPQYTQFPSNECFGILAKTLAKSFSTILASS